MSEASDRAHGPVPLVLGAAGHRNLPDEDRTALEATVRNAFAEMRRQYPATPMIVLSSLAEGADRLVAHMALDADFALIVPMPFEQQEYERDFSSSDSVDEFRALLARAETSFAVPLRPESTLGERDRHDAYARCTAYIVRNCVELIALWDGRTEARPGGTADAVSFQLEGIPAPYVPESDDLDPARTGPVLHVMTRRSGEGAFDSGEPVAEMRTLYPPLLKEDEARKAFEKLKSNLDRFNAEAARAHDGERWTLESVRDRLEVIARLYQGRVTASLTTIFGLVFLSAVGLNFYLFLPHHPLPLLVGYLAITAVAYGVFRISTKADWQDRYQDARALSEALRVVYFWRLAGIHDSVADLIVRAEHAEIDWLPVAVRAVAERPGTDYPSGSSVPADTLDVVRREWIDDQCRYFTVIAGNSERAHQRVATRTATIGVVFSVGISLAIKLLQQVGIVNGVIAFASSLFAMAAAMVHGYADKRGWSDHARRYDRMAWIFLRAKDALDAPAASASGHRNFRSVLRRLGREAVQENVTWLVQQRTRKITVPHA
ncbi:MAG TPA: hypothetical protein VKR56_13430 [Candidatus Cybelea sp.]|nr:hypothetical protein [Candidatus Cybelea sp.]